jgi:hypothetical protein
VAECQITLSNHVKVFQQLLAIKKNVFFRLEFHDTTFFFFQLHIFFNTNLK